MRKINFFLIIFLLSPFLVDNAISNMFRHAQAKATLKVIGEDARPIKDASVNLCFFAEKKDRGEGCFNGLTDKKGLFTGSYRSYGIISYYAKKEGYYMTTGEKEIWFTKEDDIRHGKWQPWNPTVEVVLKKVINPVPMYAKGVNVKIIPETNKPIGYDLEKGDWVAPFGDGIISDFIFTFKGKFKGIKNREASLKIDFSNKGDGLFVYKDKPYTGSKLRLPHKAPINGYKGFWYREKYIRPDGSRKNLGPIDKNQNYIFRVRTILDKKGKVKKANYGKIHGDFDFGYTGDGRPSVSFVYYFNPNNTRNIEFDMEKNLFSRNHDKIGIVDP